MNISKIPALHELIANDAYAMTFQSLPQYRAALLQSLATLANQPAPTVPVAWRDALRRSGATDHHGRIAFLPAQLEQFASILTAHEPAQEQAEPFKWPNGCDKTIPRALRYLANNPRPFGGEEHFNGAHLDQLAGEIETAARKIAAQQEPVAAPQQAAAPRAVLEILRDVHDTLESQADSDLDHFEDDDEEREGAPMQYAARRVMQVIQLIERSAQLDGGAA